VSGHAGQEHLATFEVDEEQHVEPAQHDRVDMKKSHARVPAAWARRNSDQDGPDARAAGRRPSRPSTLRTLVGETATPSLAHSPTMRR
jgi:hypothetical protein